MGTIIERKRKDKPIATLVISGPGTMTPEGRKDIANWLRLHAADLIRHGRTCPTAPNR